MTEPRDILETASMWLGLWNVSTLLKIRYNLIAGEGTHLGTPPFEPIPSQYACPLPSMICPGAPVMRTAFPPRIIGSKVDRFVKPKVVVPANVTTAPCLTLERSMELLGGA